MITREELDAIFATRAAADCMWHAVKERRASRRDLHAMMLLDSLLPVSAANEGAFGHDVLSSAGKDQVWLTYELEDLLRVLTPELCLELRRCGVQYEPGEGFFLYV